MLVLSSTSDLLRVITSSAATVEVHASWVDLSGSTATPGRTNTAISSATTTTVVTSPASSTYRNIKTLTVTNTHATTACTVTVVLSDGTTVADLIDADVPAGYSLQYNEGAGFGVYDTAGRILRNMTTTDGAIQTALLASPQIIDLLKVFTAAKAAGNMQSAWLSSPSAGAAPPAYTAGSGYTCSRTTTGALPYANSTVATNRIAAAIGGLSVAGTLILYDRLWSCGGMGFAAATYTVTTPGSLPARVTDNGAGCEVFIEQFVAAGAASGTATLNYVNAAGSSVSAVIPAVVSAPVAGQIQRFPISDGIRSITSIVTSATWTSGSFGATIARRLLTIPATLANVVSPPLDWNDTQLRTVPNDACLMLALMPTATTAATSQGTISLVDI